MKTFKVGVTYYNETGYMHIFHRSIDTAHVPPVDRVLINCHFCNTHEVCVNLPVVSKTVDGVEFVHVINSATGDAYCFSANDISVHYSKADFLLARARCAMQLKERLDDEYCKIHTRETRKEFMRLAMTLKNIATDLLRSAKVTNNVAEDYLETVKDFVSHIKEYADNLAYGVCKTATLDDIS